MEVEAIRVVAGEVSQEAVAVLGRAEAGPDGAPHQAEAVDGADGRPRVLLSAEGDIRAGRPVARVVLGDALVVVDDELGDFAVLAEVLRLAQTPEGKNKDGVSVVAIVGGIGKGWFV